MKLELLSAANFLTHLVRLAKRGVSEYRLGRFRYSLIQVLRRRYRDHWFPDKPFKGSGYRCVRINGRMDPVIGQAGDESQLSSAFLHSTFPSELTMWIDPLEVSYRIGENGSICVLYEYSEGVTEPWMPLSLRKDKKTRKGPPIQPADPHTQVAAINKPALRSPNPTCKDSLRLDYLLDPRKTVNIEELAALVSDTTPPSEPKTTQSEGCRQNGAGWVLQAEPQEVAASTAVDPNSTILFQPGQKKYYCGNDGCDYFSCFRWCVRRHMHRAEVAQLGTARNPFLGRGSALKKRLLECRECLKKGLSLVL